jgi:hypothetical protein
MRRAVLLITAIAAALVVVSGVALAAVIDCTGGLCPGTNNNDTVRVDRVFTGFRFRVDSHQNCENVQVVTSGF